MVPAFRDNGLGYMDTALVAETANTVATYMSASKLPAVDKMFTNQFVGAAKLTPAEWQAVEARVSKFQPGKRS
jgi:hypothetical protein